MRERDLYPPVKDFLEGQGYAVKGEIGDCDVLAVRGEEPPVVVELKLRISLELILQGIDRLKVTDTVYLAVPPFKPRASRQRQRDILALCRRLGLGLLTVQTDPSPGVHVLLDPVPYEPRRNKVRLGRLLGEFQRRVGDPAAGGVDRRRPGMTAYRQQALFCAAHLSRHGPTKASQVAEATGVERARAILYRDVYGWFERVGIGIYQITPKGQAALKTFADVIAEITRPDA